MFLNPYWLWHMWESQAKNWSQRKNCRVQTMNVHTAKKWTNKPINIWNMKPTFCFPCFLANQGLFCCGHKHKYAFKYSCIYVFLDTIYVFWWCLLLNNGQNFYHSHLDFQSISLAKRFEMDVRDLGPGKIKGFLH